MPDTDGKSGLQLPVDRLQENIVHGRQSIVNRTCPNHEGHEE